MVKKIYQAGKWIKIFILNNFRKNPEDKNYQTEKMPEKLWKQKLTAKNYKVGK